MYTLLKKIKRSTPGIWAQGTSFRYYTFPLLLWMLIMIVLSSLPGDGIVKPYLIQWDKIAHFIEFFIFTFLLSRYLLFVRNFPLTKTLVTAVILSSVYAVFDEVHQLYIPYRDCSFFDFLADLIGVIAGGVFFKLTGFKDKIIIKKAEA